MGRLCDEIQSAIIQQGFTQREVAGLAGISVSYLNEIIKGGKKPSDKVLNRLAEVLHLNLNYAYYLLGKYPPEVCGLEIPLPILDKALNWLKNPYDYTLRKVS